MAYDRKKIYNQAIQKIQSKKLFFVEDVIGVLPVARATFYDFFPPDSDELNTIKDHLAENRVDIKVNLRKKMLDSSNPAALLGLYKLVCTDEERRMLSMTEVKVSQGDEPLFDLGLLTDKEREIWAGLYAKATGKEVTIDIDYEDIEPEELPPASDKT